MAQKYPRIENWATTKSSTAEEKVISVPPQSSVTAMGLIQSLLLEGKWLGPLRLDIESVSRHRPVLGFLCVDVWGSSTANSQFLVAANCELKARLVCLVKSRPTRAIERDPM